MGVLLTARANRLFQVQYKFGVSRLRRTPRPLHPALICK